MLSLTFFVKFFLLSITQKYSKTKTLAYSDTFTVNVTEYAIRFTLILSFTLLFSCSIVTVRSFAWFEINFSFSTIIFEAQLFMLALTRGVNLEKGSSYVRTFQFYPYMYATVPAPIILLPTGFPEFHIKFLV